MEHFGIVEGADLNNYLVVQCAVLIFVGLLLIASVRTIVNRCRQHDQDWITNVNLLVDIAIGVLVLVYVIRGLSDTTSSAKSAASILENFENIPWSSSSVTMQTKLDSFFDNVQNLNALISSENNTNLLANAILLVNLLRVVQFTSLHPRLAMLVGTLVNAADDLWHTAILTCLLMLSFAAVGTWRFGDRLAQFETFQKSMQLEWEMMFGAFPENWSGDKQLEDDLKAWTSLYQMILFLLIINFVLAIIVEAYMKCREEAVKNQCESEFFRDVYNTLVSTCLRIVRGWPEPAKLGEEVATWKAKISVGYRDLLNTGLFRSPEACVSFLEFYSLFDFLEPPLVGKYGMVSEDQKPDKSSGTLKEELLRNIVQVVARRESQGRGQQEETLKLKLLRGAAYNPEREPTELHSVSVPRTAWPRPAV